MMRDGLGYRRGLAYVKIVLPLPPSDNHIYFNVTSTKPGGFKQHHRAPTAEAKKYKREVASDIASLALANNVEFKLNTPFLCILNIFFEEIENKGWVKGKADSRYKKVDTENRNKLLIDAITEAIGVDDHQLFFSIKIKHQDKKDPRVEAEIYQISDLEFKSLQEAINDAVRKTLWD